MKRNRNGLFAYPLAWPTGWPRTRRPKRSRFDVGLDSAARLLSWEVERLHCRYVTISTNIPLRRDGLPYAGGKPDNGDCGVAVYFERDGKQMAFACDRWDRVGDNMRAIEKTISAIRGIERWGASDMMERALRAFEALPAPKTPWEILGINPGATEGEIIAAYRRQAMRAHPDRGGTDAQMAEINSARDSLLKMA